MMGLLRLLDCFFGGIVLGVARGSTREVILSVSSVTQVEIMEVGLLYFRQLSLIRKISARIAYLCLVYLMEIKYFFMTVIRIRYSFLYFLEIHFKRNYERIVFICYFIDFLQKNLVMLGIALI